MKNQTLSVSKAKKAIADYNKAIGRPEGLAELSMFFARRRSAWSKGAAPVMSGIIALIRMYDRSVNRV